MTSQEIVAGLRALGIEAGSAILVHSSLSSFGYVAGGAGAVIDAMLAAVGPAGTVVVPTLTGTPQDGPAHPPVFDVRSSPCWTGRIPTEFLRRPGVRRSLHPTHSVAGLGALMPALVEGHESCLTPCGPQSPYYRLAEKGGFVVLLGVGQGSNTTLHTAEELAGVPYHLQGEPTDCVVIGYDGVRRVHRLYLHAWGTPRRFERIDEDLTQLGIMRMGTIGLATVRVIRALPMIEWVVGKLREDPGYLVASR